MFELKKDKKIYVVTNRKLIKEDNIYNVIEACAKKGTDAVILREKDLEYDDLRKLAEGIKIITEKYNILLIINGNINVAVDIEADGFHTGFNSFKDMVKNNILNFKIEASKVQKKFLYGVSVHSINEGIEAEKLQADYLIAGNVFETDCKPGLKGRGLEFIEDLSRNVNIPVIAIGGINHSNIEEILNSGAEGAAVMSYAMKITTENK
ncbi:thiamine phosphate synthase [Clostridiaceae bacterium UIB06]|uniref:Thiamine phosphate synthase n=1 Tax=Clostridium thailandense TaxID=2794346 RepID=A0A949X289_9CLOT|nr:thiamine phosphate synthase [Clostridium thailandense]MBV7272944.1 thiamine phosphate synthase [Clostridium thailandense]MCH5136245.1 thiamine phosphate synthase [Clostridiaceae bacterium UIB06]